MFEKNCPYCAKPISAFSKGMMKGKFDCPHCGGNLKSRPGIGMIIAAGIGGAIGAILHVNLAYIIPVAIIISYPFTIKPVKSE